MGSKKEEKRFASSCFWTDSYISELSTDEKLMYMYLITNMYVDMTGIYEISKRQISFDTGISKERTEAILSKFDTDNKLFYVNGYIALKNYLKYQETTAYMLSRIVTSYSKTPIDVIKAVEARFPAIISRLEETKNHPEEYLTSKEELERFNKLIGKGKKVSSRAGTHTSDHTRTHTHGSEHDVTHDATHTCNAECAPMCLLSSKLSASSSEPLAINNEQTCAPDEKNSVASDNVPVVVGCGRHFEQAHSSSEGEGEPEEQPMLYGHYKEKMPKELNETPEFERTKWKIDHFVYENGYVFYNMSMKMDLKELREIWKRYAKRLGERNAYSLFIKATMVYLKNSKIKKPDTPAAYFQDMLSFAEKGTLDYDDDYYQQIVGKEINKGDYTKS